LIPRKNHITAKESNLSLIFPFKIPLTHYINISLCSIQITKEEKMSMHGKFVLITGATSGIGKETALGLAKMGATVVFTSRDAQQGEQTRQHLIEVSKNPNIDMLYCDLASFASIRECCREFLKKYPALHVLINNAGIVDYHRRESKDGIENMFAANYLAPFLMTNLLLDILKKSAPARIINLTSGLHSGTIHFDDLEFRQGFSGMKVYGHSKLAIIIFTRLLAENLKGTGVTANCVNPGMSSTNLGRDAGWFSARFFKFFGKKPSIAAQTPIYLASASEVKTITGEYFEKKSVKKINSETYDMDVARKLWEISKKYVGL
jgi:NAD(P)-dependent dehydrogenase (short-subunit alcohol dehydrogenase family)